MAIHIHIERHEGGFLQKSGRPRVGEQIHLDEKVRPFWMGRLSRRRKRDEIENVGLGFKVRWNVSGEGDASERPEGVV